MNTHAYEVEVKKHMRRRLTGSPSQRLVCVCLDLAGAVGEVATAYRQWMDDSSFTHQTNIVDALGRTLWHATELRIEAPTRLPETPTISLERVRDTPPHAAVLWMSNNAYRLHSHLTIADEAFGELSRDMCILAYHSLLSNIACVANSTNQLTLRDLRYISFGWVKEKKRAKDMITHMQGVAQ